ncbi:MAG: twin transmembrane helix small protein [Paracoccaceae bacterium]|nr:twin transmembrane helix small protein [Paracoccaceae bacterium]
MGQVVLVVALIACLAVLAILLFGVGSFAKGGEFNRKYANKIMQARIIAQAAAVVLILLAVWVLGNE